MKLRPILLVIGTLIIGFVLGMLTSAQLRYNRLKPVRVYFSEERFRDGIYSTIQPDEQQKAKIDLILNKYARINSELQSDFRSTLDSSMNEFRKELESNLTQEQLTKLKEMDDKRHEMYLQNRKNREQDSSSIRGDRQRNKADRPLPSGDSQHFERRDSSGSSNHK